MLLAKKTKTSTSGKFLIRVTISTFLLFILVLFMVYLAVDNQFYKTLLFAAENQIKAKNDEISYYLESKQSWIQAKAKNLEFENNSQNFTQNKQALEKWLRDNRFLSDENFQDLVFLDLNGELLSATGNSIKFTDPLKYGKQLFVGGSYFDYLIKDQKGDSLITDHIFLDYIKDKYVAFMVFHSVKNSNGKVIGALGAAFKTGELNKIIRDINIGFYTQPLLVDSKALSIAHIFESHVGVWNLAKEERGVIGLKEAAKDHMKNPRFEIKEFTSTPFKGFNPTGRNIGITVILLPVRGAQNTWEIGVSVPNLSFKLPMFKTMLIVALVFLLGFLAVFFLFYISLGAFNRQIKKVADRLSEISQGDGDLTIGLEKLNGNDSLPKLVNNFNEFVKAIAIIVEDIMATSLELNAYSDSISTSSEKMEKDMHKQQEEIDLINFNMQQMVTSVVEVSTYAQDAAKTAKESNEDSKAGTLSLASVVESINYQADAINATALDIENLQDAGASIGEVMEVINAIAEQTNLLALNAAIEAARAGEAGRGFAVVADEVRSLAGRTHQSTGEISHTIDNLRQSIDASATAMRASIEQSKITVEQANMAGDSIEDLAMSIDRIAKMNLLIASSTEEQTATVDELSANLAKIVEVAATTNVAAIDLKNKAENLINTSKKLQAFVNKFKI